MDPRKARREGRPQAVKRTESAATESQHIIYKKLSDGVQCLISCSGRQQRLDLLTEAACLPRKAYVRSTVGILLCAMLTPRSATIQSLRIVRFWVLSSNWVMRNAEFKSRLKRQLEWEVKICTPEQSNFNLGS